MDQALAPSLAPSPTIVFHDGLGERHRVTDPTGRESVDLWYLNPELSAAVEAGLRERVKRLADLGKDFGVELSGLFERVGAGEGRKIRVAQFQLDGTGEVSAFFSIANLEN